MKDALITHGSNHGMHVDQGAVDALLQVQVHPGACIGLASSVCQYRMPVRIRRGNWPTLCMHLNQGADNPCIATPPMDTAVTVVLSQQHVPKPPLVRASMHLHWTSARVLDW
eukprot:870312-Pelagomonas_calceolata.AAC.1